MILAVNTLVFVLMAVDEVYLHHLHLERLALNPHLLFRGHIYELITFQFLHGSFLHYLFNSLSLYFIGHAAENSLGRGRFLEVYFTSGALGGLLQGVLGLISTHFEAPTVGASAGICALVALLCVLEPDQTFYIQFFLPIRAKYLLTGLLCIAVFFILVPIDPGVAHGAHLGGLLGGMGYVHWVLHRERRLADFFPKRRPRQSSPPLVKATVSKHSLWGKASQATEDAPVDDLPPSEFISREVDPILDKISAHGIQSLTERERRILDAARKKMSRR
ncbi:MAG TPA: rhomboid family intramembrane serine protease [Verrucomicrobiae bacterium]|nr:rhomboid family intramembrane serine protease [Verrucomicrobiae bacterium]